MSDRKIPYSSNGSTIDYYNVDVVSAQDYYPFGMLQPGRSYNAGGYRYGFNGKENDNEVKGEGNQQDYGMRIYDPRHGRFLSVDPITKDYPELTPYQFASNNPISGIDLDGLEFELSTIKNELNMRARLSDQVAISRMHSEQVRSATTSKPPLNVRVHRFFTENQGLQMETNVAYLSLKIIYHVINDAKIVGSSFINGGRNATDLAGNRVDERGRLLALGNTGLTMVGVGEGIIAMGEKNAMTEGVEVEARTATGETSLNSKCFVSGTKVLTKSGLKSIEDIRVGDSVWAFNDTTNAKKLKEVISLSRNIAHQLIRLEIGNEIIWTTPEHPFWVDKSWISARSIKRGDSVLLFSGLKQNVLNKFIKDTTVKVYNFTVSGFHNYYVSALSILVHNNCLDAARSANYKGFSSGKLKTHFEKHGAEFGEISQSEYLKLAKGFASESGVEIQEQIVGNFYVKYDNATRRTLISHIKDREIRTFYKADGRSVDPFADAVKLAEELSKAK